MALCEAIHHNNSNSPSCMSQQQSISMKLNESCEMMLDEVVDYDLDEENLKLNIMDLYPKDSGNLIAENHQASKSSPAANNKKQKSSTTTKSSTHRKSSKKSHKKVKKIERVSSISSISSFLDTSISSMSSMSTSISSSSNCSSCSCCSGNICETSSSSVDLIKKSSKTALNSREKSGISSRNNRSNSKKTSKSAPTKKSSSSSSKRKDESEESGEIESSGRKPKSSRRHLKEEKPSSSATTKRVKSEKAALAKESKKSKTDSGQKASKRKKRRSDKSDDIQAEYEKKSEAKRDTDELCDETTPAVAAPAMVAPAPPKEKIIILIDFELVLDCDQCSRKQALKELNELSEILPVLAYKLANFNYASYYNQFSNKLRLVKCHQESIQSLKSMNELDLTESGGCAFDTGATGMNNETNGDEKFELAQDLKSKLDLVDKVVGECMHRLEMQHAYLNQVIKLFEQFAKCRTSLELDARVKEKRGHLLDMQAKLIEYAYSILLSSRVESLDEVYFIKTMPFNALVDVLDRFVLVYNL
jgi:hypothetical protein